MRSIHTKFLILMLVCSLLSSSVIGTAGVLSLGKVADEDAARIMDSICSKKAWEMDSLFSRIEQSIETIADYSTDQFEDLARFQTDSSFVDRYTESVEDVLINSANHTEGALSAYIRYNPEFTSPTSGLFYSRESPDSDFVKLAPTDFSQYAPSDTEHVGWYYIPVEMGQPTWMQPYYNKNLGVQIISYVVPIQVQDVIVGVVGMDIDFNIIKRIVYGTSVYQSGYALLVDDNGNTIYHKDYLEGTPISDIDDSLKDLAAFLSKDNDKTLFSYELNGQKKEAVFNGLHNGMKFILTAPVDEIHAAKKTLVLQIMCGAILIAAVTMLLASLLARRMIIPLRELNAAAQRIAAGDLSVHIAYHSNDEIGTLAESFRITAKQLSHYIDYVKGLAYRDPMTGIKSKTAYMEAVAELDEAIRRGCLEFGVVVFDINGLKDVNDRYGHDFGDLLIIASCKIICDTFKHSPVYRIGGDEFVVILENSDLKKYSELSAQFMEAINSYNKTAQPQLKVSIARGIAIYNPKTDASYLDVFKRADTSMYRNKAQIKADLT